MANARGILSPPEEEDYTRQLRGLLGNLGQQNGWQALTALGAGLAGNATQGWGAGIGAGLQGANQALGQNLSDRISILNNLAQLKAKSNYATDDIREYQMAVQQGFRGNIIDFFNAKRGGSTANEFSQREEAARRYGLDPNSPEGRAFILTNKSPYQSGLNPPTGYRFKEGTNELEAIPGGPAAKLPAEVAGKVGMMHTAQQSLPVLRNIFLGEKDAKTGKRSGSTISFSDYYLKRGDTGEGWRLGTGAIESVLRAASGAAVPETEVKRYSELFLPTPYDTEQTTARKIDALERWIGNMFEAIQSGRPPILEPENSGGANENRHDPLGIR